MTRIVVIGEGMLELVRKGENWQLGYGGDTLNTAIHLARAGHEVAFLTALGSDPLSVDLKDKWTAEGLDTSTVLNHPGLNTGLYAISTDDACERSFTYWPRPPLAAQSQALRQKLGSSSRTVRTCAPSVFSPPKPRITAIGQFVWSGQLDHFGKAC